MWVLSKILLHTKFRESGNIFFLRLYLTQWIRICKFLWQRILWQFDIGHLVVFQSAMLADISGAYYVIAQIEGKEEEKYLEHRIMEM